MPLNFSKKCCGLYLKQNSLLIATIVGVALGIIIGLLLRNIELNEEAKTWIKLWGELFLRMLKVLILPLIMSCLVTGIASMEGSASGRLGAVTVLYVLVSHLIAVTFAVGMAVVLKPGRWWDQTDDSNTIDQSEDVAFTDIFADFIRNLFPDNIVRACLQNAYTDVSITVLSVNNTNVTTHAKQLLYRDGTNTLGVIVFSAAMGLALSVSGEEGKPLFSVFKSLEKVIFKVMFAVVWYSPIGIISLVASALIEVESIQSILKSVGLYLLTVLLSMAIHHFALLPLSYFAIVRKNPFKYYFNLLEALLAAFAPPSSVAAIPGLFSACKDKLGVDPRAVDFCIPVLSTINRGGSAMFIAISTVFAAQSYDVDLGSTGLLLIIVLTSVLCPAIAAVPSASIVVLITVCAAVNVPIADRLALIFALEWLSDRIRTTNNVASTGYGCAIIERLCKQKLQTTPGDNDSSTYEEKHSFIQDPEKLSTVL